MITIYIYPKGITIKSGNYPPVFLEDHFNIMDIFRLCREHKTWTKTLRVKIFNYKAT